MTNMSESIENQEVVTIPTEDVQVITKEQPLTDSISVISVSGSPLRLSNEFKNALAQIQPTVDSTKKFLKMDIATIDEDDLKESMAELDIAQKMKKRIADGRTAVKKYFNEVRDENIELLDKELELAGYGELDHISTEAKKLKKDISAFRINSRWEELKPTFEANIAQYEAITRLAPALADYGSFRVRNQSLINGAKSFKLGDKHRSAVNNEMHMINSVIKEIEENADELTSQRQFALLNDFIKVPTKETHLTRATYYRNLEKTERELRVKQEAEEKARLEKEQEEARIAKEKAEKEAAERARIQTEQAKQKAELEARQKILDEQAAKNEAERAKKAQLQAELDAKQRELNEKKRQEEQRIAQLKAQEEAEAKRKAAELAAQQTLPKANTNEPAKSSIFDQTSAMNRPQATNEFPWLSELITTTPKYQKIHNNNKIKITLLYDMFTSLGNKNSLLVKQTKLDPDVVARLTQYVLDL